MKAIPKRKTSTEIRYYGPSRRIKLHIYADGTARLHYRRPVMRGLFTGVKHAWEYCGEFPLAHAEHIAKTFEDAVESQARACTVMTGEP
jgi:hypothetical protein